MTDPMLEEFKELVNGILVETVTHLLDSQRLEAEDIEDEHDRAAVIAFLDEHRADWLADLPI